MANFAPERIHRYLFLLEVYGIHRKLSLLYFLFLVVPFFIFHETHWQNEGRIEFSYISYCQIFNIDIERNCLRKLLKEP